MVQVNQFLPEACNDRYPIARPIITSFAVRIWGPLINLVLGYRQFAKRFSLGCNSHVQVESKLNG